MNNLKKQLKKYIDKNLTQDKRLKVDLLKKIKSLYGEEDCYEDFKCNEVAYSINKSNDIDNSNLKDYINLEEKYNNFQTILFKLIDNKNLKDSDVYNKVHMDRRLFSKIRSDKNYHPSKETIILLAIALELNEQELDNLLESASYSLPKNNKYDLIIRFCFINKIFKISDINELLFEYNCKLFNY